jgi:hypothetical protein
MTSIGVAAVLHLKVDKDLDKVIHDGLDFALELSDNLDESAYFEKDGKLKEEGIKAVTNVLVQALLGNIHSGHQNKKYDSAEHLRFIIKELERGFVENVTIK